MRTMFRTIFNTITVTFNALGRVSNSLDMATEILEENVRIWNEEEKAEIKRRQKALIEEMKELKEVA